MRSMFISTALVLTMALPAVVMAQAPIKAPAVPATAPALQMPPDFPLPSTKLAPEAYRNMAVYQKAYRAAVHSYNLTVLHYWSVPKNREWLKQHAHQTFTVKPTGKM